MDKMSVFNEDNVFSFKRKYYKRISDFVQNSLCSVMLVNGPRKVGKTVLLKQLEKENTNAIYYSFKEDPDSVADVMFEALNSNLGKVYLFDEIIYCKETDVELARFANRISDLVATGVKIKSKFIFSGSQCAVQEYWFRNYFATEAEILNVPFLQYDEYLEYAGIPNSEESFSAYVFNAWKFSKISSNREYLQSCLVETVNSMHNSRENVRPAFFSNTTTLVEDTEKLLFAVVLKLHNHMRWGRIFNPAQSIESLRKDLARISSTKVKEGTFKEICNNLLTFKCLNFDKLDFNRFREALLFALNSGLVIISCNYEIRNSISDLFNWLKNGVPMRELSNVNQFFEKYKFREAPLFDFGLGLFEHDLRYQHENFRKCLELMDSKPFARDNQEVIEFLDHKYNLASYLPECLDFTGTEIPSPKAESYLLNRCKLLGVETRGDYLKCLEYQI